MITELEISSSFNYEKKEKFYDFNNNEPKPMEEKVKEIFEPQEILRIVFHMIEKINLSSDETGSQPDFMIEYYAQKNVILDLVPLHSWTDSVKREKMSENEEMKKYFGEHTSIYFFFLSYLQVWLVVPALAGLAVYLLNNFLKLSVETSPFDSLYSFFMIIWGALFVSFWTKGEEKIAHNWQCFGKSLESRKKLHFSEQHFEKRINDATGMLENYFPTRKRLVQYLISIVKLLPILAFTFFFLVCSLNVRGFVLKEHKYIYIEKLSVLAEKGNWFEKGSVRGIIPTILHVVLISIISSYYKETCNQTTKNEYHKTMTDFENVLILKRFLFETFYAFTDFIYIAFITLDIEGLRNALVSLFLVDEIRRLVTESLIPYVKRRLSTKKMHFKQDKHELLDFEEYVDQKIVELKLATYQPFDDYLEIVINFGYITLFASAFPLAPLIIFIFHFLEEKSDKYKIYSLYRRPQPERANTIGSWRTVLNMIVMISVITNVVLSSFSSNKILEFMNIFYDKIDEKSVFYQYGDRKNQGEIDWNSIGKFIILIVFGMEHFLFILVFLIKRWVSNLEDWTSLYKKRKIQKQKLSKIKTKRNLMLASKFGCEGKQPVQTIEEAN